MNTSMDTHSNEASPIAATAAGVTPALSMVQLLLLLLWPIFVVAAGAVVTLRVVRSDQAELMTLRPPIAVIDTHRFIERQPTSMSPNDRAQAGFKQADQAAKKLRDSGFLIIDRGQVLSAPEPIQVPTPVQK
jgi:hypothetical protein